MRIILFCLMSVPFVCGAQSPVVTAFPSLRIPSSSRGLAMGDCGIASATDNQQLYYNAAKTAYTQNFHQVALNYTPWLSGVSNDVRFLNVNYLGSMYNTSAMGLSVSYLNLGNITTRDNNGAILAEYTSREYNIGAAYALQLTDKTSLGVGFRLLGQNGFASEPKNILSISGDLSYYQYVNLSGDRNKKIEWGLVLSNIGPKLSIQNNSPKTFLPTNLGLGIGYSSISEIDGSQFTVALDVNKLLVPSIDGNDKGIFQGMFASFSDPNQFQLLRISTGIEYGFINQFFLRGGVAYENPNKGNRKYFGLGVGYKGFVLDQSYGIDFHYLVPFSTIATVSPFQNAFGFSLKLSFGNFQ